jgi:hypothetical protein
MTELISVVFSAGGVLAAVYAAFQAKRAADAAAESAKSSLEQARLLRPLPLPRIYFRRSIGNNPSGDKSIRGGNTGDSTAFDITISELHASLVAGVEGYDGVLFTEPIDFLYANSPEASFIHRLESPSAGAIFGSLQPLETFISGLSRVFDALELRNRKADSNYQIGQTVHNIEFDLRWKAKDGRRFRQKHRLCIQFIRLEAWIAALGEMEISEG